MARRVDRGVKHIAIADSGSLGEHVGLIKRQIDRSLDLDDQTIQLAGRLVSGTFDWAEDPRSGRSVPVVEAWDRNFRAPGTAVCGPRDYACEIQAIWDFVVLNLRYVADRDGVDVFKTTELALTSGSGDCDDFTVVFASLLHAVGYKVVARVISTKGSNHWEHIYPMVGLSKDRPSGWLPLDATVTGATPGWQYPHIGRIRDFWV